MRKQFIFFLIIFVVLITFFIIWTTHFKVAKKHQICQTDNDCTPFIFSCGNCEDYSIAINSKFSNKYQKRYWNKCVGRFIDCDALPKGESKCINNLCTLIK